VIHQNALQGLAIIFAQVAVTLRVQMHAIRVGEEVLGTDQCEGAAGFGGPELCARDEGGRGVVFGVGAHLAEEHGHTVALAGQCLGVRLVIGLPLLEITRIIRSVVRDMIRLAVYDGHRRHLIGVSHVG